MLEKFLRSKYQVFFVDPFAHHLMRIFPISPNIITLFGCFFGILSAILIALKSVWLALFFLLLSGFLDTLDGTIARFTQRTSPQGTVCDIVCDRIVEAAIVIGLFLYAPHSRGILALLMMGSILICVTSFLVIGIFSENQSEKSFFYSSGIIERAEAFLFFTLMILFPSLFLLLSSLFILLVCLTACIRIVQFANI